ARKFPRPLLPRRQSRSTSPPAAFPIQTCSSAPPVISASPTSSSGNAPTPSCTSPTPIGRTSDERISISPLRSTAGESVSSAGFATLFAVLGYSRTNAYGPRRPFRVYAGCLIYVGLLLSTLVLVRDADEGRRWFFLGLLATFAVDTGAYAVGKLVGRHKMAPK